MNATTAQPLGVTTQTASREFVGKRYIVSPAYDWIFFLLTPLASLAIGIWLATSSWATREYEFHGHSGTLHALLLNILIHAHLFAVFFRSHGRSEILNRYRFRLIGVPILLYIALVSSTWAIVIATVLATFWDVYHSSCQTFGFARIYDNRLGENTGVGRRLDYWVNLLLYTGPMLAGVTMIDHFNDFEDFGDVGADTLASVPVYMMRIQPGLRMVLLIGGGIFLAYYLAFWFKRRMDGHPVSLQKIFLVVSTGICSVICWGYNSFGEAFFVMNLFHAIQYVALVWHSEKKTVCKVFSVGQSRTGLYMGLGLFLAAIFSYGYLVEAFGSRMNSLWAFTMVVSLMHFWYDGFIWPAGQVSKAGGNS